MQDTKKGYWISRKNDGTIFHLYKIEDYFVVYRFVNGNWQKLNPNQANEISTRIGFDDNYDYISELEAQKVIENL